MKEVAREWLSRNRQETNFLSAFRDERRPLSISSREHYCKCKISNQVYYLALPYLLSIHISIFHRIYHNLEYKKQKLNKPTNKTTGT